MSERGDLEFIQDIKEAVSRINEYTSDLDYKAFLSDTKTQDAVVRNIEIIGEATKRISKKLKQKYPDIPWDDMARTRDKIIHFYFGVNYDIVWGIVKEELPGVLQQVKDALKKEAI